MAAIKLEIKRCMDGCPHCKKYYTIGAGCADDYHCELVPHVPRENEDLNRTRTDVGRMVSGYVEWDREKNDVPDWCPLLIPDLILPGNGMFEIS